VVHKEVVLNQTTTR